MLDLTGENLVTYILRELKDIVSRNPRFRNLGGDAIITTPNLIAWNDLQVEVGTIQASGNRLSPDYFMCTQHGHAILAKLENKNGTFIEWVQELRNTEDTLGSLNFPVPGVYYLNVDSVNEGTREVGLTMETYRWANGIVGPAEGSGIYFASNIDVPFVTPTDPSIEFVIKGSVMYITSYTTQQPLQLQTPAGPLTPNVDFWYERRVTEVLTESTTTGTQDVTILGEGFSKLVIEDQNEYELRDGTDFQWSSDSRLRLGQYTPPGSTLTATYTVRVDPSTTSVVRDENKLPMTVAPGEALAEGQIYGFTSLGHSFTETDLVVAGDGTVWLKRPLEMGEVLTWEARINAGESTIKAKKLAQNPQIIPGLMIGIGDEVEVDDQCVILVSPDLTETYEVYGSKENITFNINIRANDRLTASDIATSIRSHLLVRDRFEMESNGLTVFEISKSSAIEQKGNSGVATTTTYTLTVSAAADWELYLPLTTRIGSIDVDIQFQASANWPSNPSIVPRMSVLGKTQFVPQYM